MQKTNQINISNEYLVDVNTILGRGSTGIVCSGVNLINNTEKVAVKIIDLKTIENQVTEYLLRMEKLALSLLRNPYILHCLKIVQNKKFCFMVTQYCNGGTLKSYIQQSNSGYLTEQESFIIMKCLLQGYYQLVQKKIIHRDLKPANIMMHNRLPKIIDFGYCEIDGHKKPDLDYNVGSPSYMAPQSYKMSVYNEKTEIWALGVILYECLTGRTLDEGRQMIDTYRQIKKFGIPFPPHVSQKSKRIINWCLRLNPTQRPTCFELLNSSFFKQKQSKGGQTQRINRPHSQYQKHQNIFNQPQQDLLTIKSKHLPLKIQENDENIQKMPFRKEIPQFYQKSQKKMEYYTERKNPSYIAHKQQRYEKKVTGSKYQNNRFKPSYTVYKSQKQNCINYNRQKLSHHQVQKDSKQKYWAYKTEKTGSVKTSHFYDKENIKNPYYQNMQQKLGIMKDNNPKKSVYLPKTQNQLKVGFKYLSPQQITERIRRKHTVYEHDSNKITRI